MRLTATCLCGHAAMHHRGDRCRVVGCACNRFEHVATRRMVTTNDGGVARTRQRLRMGRGPDRHEPSS